MSTRSKRSKTFFIVVGVLVGLLSLLIVLPFLSWILIAVILAFVVLPILLILAVAANQASQLFAQFDTLDVSQIDDVVAERFGVQVDTATLHDALTGAVKTGARGLAGNLFSIIGGLPELFIGFTVLFFVLLALLKPSSLES